MKKTKFFIVDDDEFAARVHAKALEAAGYTATIETDSERALPRIQSERPDVVLLDILMPGIDGLEICRDLRSSKEFDDTKIVFVSAKSYEFDRKRALKFGANGFIVKPITSQAFVHELERIVEDRIELRFWGVRGTLPVPGEKALRYGGNTSCVSLEFPKGNFFIFDAGTGIKALSDHLLGEGRTRMEAKIFISHPHWDHINALPFFVPLYVPGNEFEICGPTHGDATMHKLISDQMDDVYFPITIREFGAHVTFRDLREETYTIDDITVSTLLLSHPGNCLGYRFEYGGRSICYVTDNELFLPTHNFYNPTFEQSLTAFVQDTDYLIADTCYTDSEYEKKVGWGHSSVSMVVHLAHEAGVKNLCLYHHDPDQDDTAIDAKLETAKRILGGLGSTTNCLAPSEQSLFKV